MCTNKDDFLDFLAKFKTKYRDEHDLRKLITSRFDHASQIRSRKYSVKFRHMLSQAAACDGVIYHINNGNSAQEPQGNFLPLLQN